MQETNSSQSSTPKPPDIVIYTDGSCRKNPGPGGSAAVVFYGDGKVAAIAKFIGENSTNNKAEICAIKIALEHVKESGKIDNQVIHLYSDSEYSLNVIAGQYKANKNKWLIDEARKLVLLALNGAGIRMFYVRGHNGHEWNEVCDVLANLASSNPGMDRTEILEGKDQLRELTQRVKADLDGIRK